MSRDAIDDAAARGAARNVNRIVALVREQHYGASRSERAGTAISRVAGNLAFVAAHVVAIVLWVAWNSIGLQINILAEQETTMVMRMLQHMSRGLDLPPFEDHVAERASETDLGEIVREIDRKVPLE